MKRLNSILKLFVLLLVFTGASINGHAQDADGVFQKVATAIQEQNSADLASYFNQSVEITVPGADEVYARNQAQFVMKDFFAKHPGKSFRIIHKGSSGSTFYATGTYTSAKGEFDVNIFLKNLGGKLVVTQIRFEE